MALRVVVDRVGMGAMSPTSKLLVARVPEVTQVTAVMPMVKEMPLMLVLAVVVDLAMQTLELVAAVLVCLGKAPLALAGLI